MSITSGTTMAEGHDHDTDYAALLAGVQAAFDTAASGGKPLFKVGIEGADLAAAYLDSLPGERQIHTCNACRHFISRFGGLVTIATDGTTEPVLWDPALVPTFYRAAVKAMRDMVARRPVTGMFLTSEAVWGTPTTGPWSHLSIRAPERVYRHPIRSAGQAMAAKHEDCQTVTRALGAFKPDLLREAKRLLDAEALARSGKFVGPVQWLLDLHEAREKATGRNARVNVTWLAVATAPEGFCHPRSSVVGSLLEDLEVGLPFDKVKRRFDAKLDGLRYQRPQAAPSAGNLQQAEAIFEKMGLARSLERRFARLEEVLPAAIWKPKPPQPENKPSGGVFGHLQPKGAPSVMAPTKLPPVTMTWEKFARTVLPNAEQLAFLVPSGRANFVAMLTAEHEDAPPILKWDGEPRNPVSTYVYHGGSTAEAWLLASGTWATVTAAVPQPNLWGPNPQPHLGTSIILLLERAADQRTGQGNALFPETLRAEVHPVRATIEAYSRGAVIGGREQASACGFAISQGKVQDCTLRALTPTGWTTYKIDRWD